MQIVDDVSVDRYELLGKGLFPETLPPCFEASDFKRALRGITPLLRERRFRKRSSELIAYNGTKHDGSRRQFGTPNPVQYFHVCEFIADNWDVIDAQIGSSPFVVSRPEIAPESADRPIVIPSLSNLSNEASKKLRYAPIIVRADVSQFFPSIYTHVIPWVAHSRDAAKADPDPASKEVYFNSLDKFIQGCQLSETRGIAIGPDAFRIVAEFIASEIDKQIHARMAGRLIGAARHVDDFFIGVMEEADARFALSVVRECLAEFRLQLNDSKTKISNGLEPLNEVWAQRLRRKCRDIRWQTHQHHKDDLALELLNFACDLATEQKSESAVKIVLRALDESKIYSQTSRWKLLEPYLQRICLHHPHSIDYIFLLVIKRVSSDLEIDKAGWKEVVGALVERNFALGHDHEIVWAVWLALTAKLELSDDEVRKFSELQNQYVNCMLIWSFQNSWIAHKPAIRFGGRISSEGGRWLEGLVARSTGYVRSRFSGAFSEEFEHLAKRKIVLVDLAAHLKEVKPITVSAISRTRYGYDSDEEDDDPWGVGHYRDDLDDLLADIPDFDD